MKSVVVLIVSAFLFCAIAVAQMPDSGADAIFLQQLPAPGPDNGPPPPNVMFHTQRFGDGKMNMGYVAVGDFGKPVTGAPYTATAITESTQTLADGNRIVNKTTTLLARDSQGRTRREETMGSFGPLAVKGPRMVFINDPVAKTSYILDLNDQSARAMKMGGGPGGQIMGGGPGVTTAGVAGPGPGIKGSKVHVEKNVIVSGGPDGGVERRVTVFNPGGEGTPAKTESLGTQVIEGVSADGKRTTRTIPAGQIGNERPLEITSEVWTSPDLHLVVMSKRSDPRFGETVYRLTDIKRVEPDPSLFEIPGSFSTGSPKN